MRKSEAKAALLRRYGGEDSTANVGGKRKANDVADVQAGVRQRRDLIETVLNSLSDSVCTLRMTTSGVTEMIHLIAKRWRPAPPADGRASLEISSHRGGQVASVYLDCCALVGRCPFLTAALFLYFFIAGRGCLTPTLNNSTSSCKRCSFGVKSCPISFTFGDARRMILSTVNITASVTPVKACTESRR